MIEVKFSGNDVADILKQMEAFVLGPAKATAAVAQSAPVYEADADDEAEVNPDAVQGVGALDSAGEAWDEVIHSPNKTQTKDGRWRLKKGAVRPEPVSDGLSAANSGTSSDGAGSEDSTAGITTSSTTISTTSTAPTDAFPSDEDDEFAAFAAAMQDTAAEVEELPVRTWTDADLSKLGNQAVQKLGNADPVKAVIARFTPEDATAHSRNIPVDQREAFAQEIEKLAGITYAG